MNLLVFAKRVYLHFYYKSGCYRRLVDENLKEALDIHWKNEFTNPIKWEAPQTLNEKIQWLQLNTDTTLWTKYADKYNVRHFVKSKGFEEYLPKLYGIWDKVEDINFDLLPEKFVIKCTHDNLSTMLIEKDKMDVNMVKKKLRKSLEREFGYSTCEPHYTMIPPRIIAEEWLENTNKAISNTIIDYKIWCYNGIPYYIMTIHGRTKDHMMIDFFDVEWNRCSDFLVYSNHYRDGNGAVPIPKSLKKMLRIATVLSKDLPQVRIDFYDVNGKPYFGEMTFTSGCGRMTYFTQEAQMKMGGMVMLPPEICNAYSDE